MKEKVEYEAGQLLRGLRNCLIFGLNLRLKAKQPSGIYRGSLMREVGGTFCVYSRSAVYTNTFPDFVITGDFIFHLTAWVFELVSLAL